MPWVRGLHPAPPARPRSLDAALPTWREAEAPTPPRPPPALQPERAPLCAPGRLRHPTHFAARQRSGSGSGSGFAGGGGGSSMAAAGVTAKAGGGTRSAAASLIRAWSPAWPWRALSCSLARGTGALKCRSDSAPPPPLARRRSRSRRGHLGNGDRPAPGYGGRRGTSLRGRRRRRVSERGSRGGRRGEGPRERPRWPGAWATEAATREALRDRSDLPRGLGAHRRLLASLVGSVRWAGRPYSPWSALGVHRGPWEGRPSLV